MKEPRLTRIFFDTIWKDKGLGFYVEIGAWDGRKKNSTILLEQAGWEGVCIEPTPASYAKLVENRKCRCLNVAIYDHEGEIEFATFPDRPEWNGIIESYDELHKELLDSKQPQLDDRVSAPAEVIKVPCKTWNSLGLPQHIDYLQIDVEGAELKVLGCIDWANTHITYICLEDNNSHTGEYKRFMEDRGYTLVAQQHVDYLYYKPA